MSHIDNLSRLSLLSSQHRLPALATMAVAFAVLVTTWDKRRKTRTHLSDLPPHLLKDVGIEVQTAREETEKPFWQA